MSSKNVQSTCTLLPGSPSHINASSELRACIHDGALHVELHGAINESMRDQASAVFAAAMQSTIPVYVHAQDAVFADKSSRAFLVQLFAACDMAHIPLHLELGDSHTKAVLTDLGFAIVA